MPKIACVRAASTAMSCPYVGSISTEMVPNYKRKKKRNQKITEYEERTHIIDKRT